MRASGSGGNLKASASFIKKAITAQAAVAQKLAKVREAAPPPVMRVNGVELNQQQVDDFKEARETSCHGDMMTDPAETPFARNSPLSIGTLATVTAHD